MGILKALGWLILLGAAAAAVAWYLGRETPVAVTTRTVELGRVEQTISAISSGMVRPAAEAKVAAGMMGRVQKVHVREGQRVSAGDLLVEMEHDDLDAQVRLAEANLRTGETRLAQIRIAASIQEQVMGSQFNQAAAQLEQAEKDFARLESLFAQEAIPRSEFEQASMALRVAREGRAAAAAGTRESLVRAEEIRAAETALEQLEAALAAARSARERAFVRAPFDGTIAKIFLEQSEAVAMGLPLLLLVQQDPPEIVAPFDEASLGALRPGLPARIEIDAFPDRTFAGEISYVAPIVAVNEDFSRTLEVRVAILEEPDRFVPGMSADITVIADSKEDVIYAPTETLIRDAFVYVIEDGRAVRRPVTTGLGNWETREILDGLREGETQITSVNLRELTDGARVQPVDDLNW